MILASHGIIGSQITQFVGLLDAYSNAAAAYSLRKLRTAYTGSAIRVRRASDSTELDIGFSANELDTSALTTFCSGTNGFVKTWYDQSGNARNATQATAASQPQIVSSGSVILYSGKPSIQFGIGVQTQLVSLEFTQLKPFRAFVALQFNTNSNSGFAFDGFNVNQFRVYNENLTRLTGYSGGGEPQYNDATGVLNKNYLVDLLADNTNTRLEVNNNTADNTAGAATMKTGVRLGANSINFGTFRGFISEYVEYNSTQNANANDIKSNINDFYSIY